MARLAAGRFAAGAARETRAELRARLRPARIPRSVPVIEEDPLDPVVIRDAPRWWRRLHDTGPVHWCPDWHFWVINGFAEAEAALRANDALSSAAGVMRVRSDLPMMLTMDRPDHTRLRKIVARDFTSARVAAMRPRIEQLAADGIEAMVAADVAEAFDDLAGPLPIEVIADLLGVPEQARREFREWSDAVVAAFASGVGRSPISPAALREYGSIMAASTRLLGLFERLIAERRRSPTDDLLSALTRTEEDGGLNARELYWFCYMLLVAGNETTTSLINGLLLALAEQPAAFAHLREDPSRIEVAIEEGLRWTSPVQAFFRTATQAYETAGVEIPAGSRVMIAYGAANRDPAVFDDPDEFRLDRDQSKHLAFGSGIHFCLGAHLARLEATIVLEQLIRRTERIELAGEPEWAENPSLRQIKRLPLRLA